MVYFPQHCCLFLGIFNLRKSLFADDITATIFDSVSLQLQANPDMKEAMWTTLRVDRFRLLT